MAKNLNLKIAEVRHIIFVLSRWKGRSDDDFSPASRDNPTIEQAASIKKKLAAALRMK